MKITKFTFGSFNLNHDDVCLSNACMIIQYIIIPKLQRRPILQLVSLHACVLDDVCACPKMMRWLETLFQAKFENIAKLKWS
jgi:hypothetical protein